MKSRITSRVVYFPMKLFLSITIISINTIGRLSFNSTVFIATRPSGSYLLTRPSGSYLLTASLGILLAIKFFVSGCQFKIDQQTTVVFQISNSSGLAGLTSQFLNGAHEFSELGLANMVLLMDQSRSVLPLRSAKAREFGELWRK